jgi:hypothetical protein
LITIPCTLTCQKRDAEYFSTQDYCYSPNKQHNTQQKIRSRGYYQASYKGTTPGPHKRFDLIDTIFYEFYFFTEDGMFFSYIAPKGPLVPFDDKFYEWNVFQKGRYAIHGDTLKLISMDKSGQFRYLLKRSYFIVKNDSEIRKIYFAHSSAIPTTENFNEFSEKHTENEARFTFVANQLVPMSSKAWMLDHRWCWCDEKEHASWTHEKTRKAKIQK